MDGVLCFMLFAGSCHMKLSDFKKQARQVSVLAFVCTLLGACFYGALFFGASVLLGLNLSLPVCFWIAFGILKRSRLFWISEAISVSFSACL